MTRSPDIIFMTEYIKNVLYFATVRQGKILKNTADTHYFCIDNDLVYENYYSDFGPLNLGCVYKYCKIINEKLKTYLNKQCIVHYTSIDPKKKANAAFLVGCYGVLYLSLPPKEALKPLMVHGQNYRPFQDATQGDSSYTISLMDCLQGLEKAHNLGFFNFQDFNYEEYESLDKIQGGDLNWIVPEKFLAFIGPVDYSVSLYHPPQMYINYFKDNNVKIVIRLNKKLYDGNVFINAGIAHYNLFFPDGSCPPRHILLKFLQISEESDGAIAVHCKAGLGRTGSLIGCYLIKHYCMSAHEAIGWMRICRPGSVIGHQQGWLEELEAWLLKQGHIYRKRTYQDVDKLPTHQFGVYSIAEKTHKQKPVVFNKSPSPPPPMQRQTRSEFETALRPQASRIREENSENDEDEVFIASCDLTIQPKDQITQIKGCVIRNDSLYEEPFSIESDTKEPLWKQLLCCKPCIETINDILWILAVRCAKITPKRRNTNKCCNLLDVAAPSKTIENEQIDFQTKNCQKIHIKGRSSGAGEPRPMRSSTRSRTPKPQGRSHVKTNDSTFMNYGGNYPYRANQTPIIKTLSDARQNILMQSTLLKDQKEKLLESSITVKPQYSFRVSNLLSERKPLYDKSKVIPSTFSSVPKCPTLPPQRRRLGRSPSPSPVRMVTEQSRATNTPSAPVEVCQNRDSKCTLREALSRLKLAMPRDGSIGAASLGARRDAPLERRAPSVRSDERPLATQGDMLNSIKFQRRIRDTWHSERHATNKSMEMNRASSKEKSSIRNVNSKTSSVATRQGINYEPSLPKEKTSTSKGFFSVPRPSSPKGRRSPHPSFY